MKRNKLLLLASFVILCTDTKAQSIEPVIDAVKFVSVEEGDASMYFEFNSLIVSNDNGEMNSYNFNWGTIELEDSHPFGGWIDNMDTEDNNMVGEQIGENGAQQNLSIV